MAQQLRVRKLRLENFGPYLGQHTIGFPAGTTFLLAENRDGRGKLSSNGSGKTTLLYAICWALFGKTPTGLTGSDLVNWNEKQCSVTLDLGHGYSIERNWKPGKESVAFTNPVDGVFKADKTIAQNRINELLGITFNLFCASLYLSRAAVAVQFLLATPSKRADILADLIDTRIFVETRKAVVKDHAEEENQWRARHGVAELLRSSIEKWQGQVAEIDQRLEAAEDSERKRKSALREQMASLQERIDTCTAIILAPPTWTMEQLEERRVALHKNRYAICDALQSLPLQSKHLQVGNCPTCSAPITQEQVDACAREAELVVKERKRLRIELDLCEADIRKIEEQQQKVRDYQAKADNARTELAAAKRELAFIQTSLAETAGAVVQLSARRSQLMSQINESSQQLLSVSAEQEKSVLKIRQLEKLKTVFGSEIRNVLFDSLRGSMEAHTAAWLRTLAGELLRVTWPSQDRQNKERFEVLVHNGNQVQDVASFSEGEGWRVSFAILLGIRQTLMERTGCKLSCLLIDDPIGGLDDAGVATFMNTLRDMGDKGLAKSILVALPRRELVDGASVVTVVKEGRKSKCTSGHQT